jgi:Abnormal spindle-like microcephaly-assoc'd, ASPM-SPD-2-Hydin
MMLKNPAGNRRWKHLSKASSALLLLAALACLAGCQGFSAAGSSQQQSGTLSLGNASLDFGSVSAGGSKTLTVTATNSGTTSVTISSASVSTKYFAISAPSLPLTIGAGQSTTLSIVFTPNASGAFNATVTMNSDASNPVTSLTLSGTGEGSAQLTLNPTSQSFGGLTVGTQSSVNVTLTNSGGTSVTVSQATITGAGFQLSGINTPLTLNPSQSASFTVTFAPQTSGAASGTVTLTSNASNPALTMSLSGTGNAADGTLAANPSSLTFGSVTVGSKQTLSETITNIGGSSITVSQVGTSGTGFSASGITAPLILTAGQSATFNVSFAPVSAGDVSGNVTITSTATNPTLNVPLSGTGVTAVGQLTVSPTTLGLGNVVAGSSGTASGSLTASGASVTVTAASTNNSVFSVGGLSLPATIQAGKSTSFTVTFSPQVAGAVSGVLTFTSSAQPGTTTEALTGTGTSAPTHSVNLSWNASTSSGISGYNIYRAVFKTSCGSYAKINSVLNTSTLYTDNSVIDGTSYCYASTAVNTSNEESGYSNIVSNIQIPTS